jgi:hypothetical protein
MLKGEFYRVRRASKKLAEADAVEVNARMG